MQKNKPKYKKSENGRRPVREVNTVLKEEEVIIIFFQLRTAAFKAYCAIWVRRSNFCHLASPRVTTREHPAAEGGTLGEKCPVILPKCRSTLHLGIYYMP